MNRGKYEKCRKLSLKAVDLTDALNELISESYKAGLAPTDSIWVRPEFSVPVIHVNFFNKFEPN